MSSKKLKLKTVTYGRIKNIGNYENERVEASAEIAADEDPREALRELKGFVLGSLGLEVKSKVQKKFCSSTQHPFTCCCDECY